MALQQVDKEISSNKRSTRFKINKGCNETTVTQLLLLFITREKKPQQFQRSGCVIKVFTGGDKKNQYC